jgi:sulfate adenylyltransferase subunit 1
MEKEKGYLDMELLRFTTAGSVDDGKSTLIGRLLFDSKAIFQDQLESLEETSKQRGEDDINLALLTDGLRSEREQGITIDVAYRYFATPNRKFIIADTPGHIQYTRNMVTGASTSNMAIILIDVKRNITNQTLRHTFISNILGLKYIILAINKMDLINFSENIYRNITSRFFLFTNNLNFKKITSIPISALNGINITNLSKKKTFWYKKKINIILFK